jgi:hypothetical protein
MYVVRNTNLIFLNQDMLISGNFGIPLIGNHGFKFHSSMLLKD